MLNEFAKTRKKWDSEKRAGDTPNPTQKNNSDKDRHRVQQKPPSTPVRVEGWKAIHSINLGCREEFQRLFLRVTFSTEPGKGCSRNTE